MCLRLTENQIFASKMIKLIGKLCRLTSMLLKETSLWHWTWRVWVKVKYGLMGRVLEDTGLPQLLVIAMTAAMLAHSDLQSASLVVANQLSDGKYCYLMTV